MVLIKDGSTENVAYVQSKNGLFEDNKITLLSALDLIKQIKCRKLLQTFEPISGLPSNISIASIIYVKKFPFQKSNKS